jgi:hypothetical protein
MLKNEPPFIPSGHENMLHLPTPRFPRPTRKHTILTSAARHGCLAKAAAPGHGQKMQM